MKQKNSAANFSIALTFLLVALSFGFEYRSYSQVEQRIVSDLNQALQRTVLQNKGLWLNADTLKTYAKLQLVMGAPVSVSSSNHSFAQALSISQLKEVSSLSLHLIKKNDSSSMLNEIPAGYITSDTLVWLSAGTDAATDLTLSFRGYARCSKALLFTLSDQTIPGLLLLAAFLSGSLSFFYSRRRKPVASDSAEQEFITFGNLSLCSEESCFYNEHRQRMRLTPLQYALMEMFYLSTSHQLSKSDICQSLWPGKDNADETLYTLIRRLKPIVEENSNLKITTDRGRAYGLELKNL